MAATLFRVPYTVVHYPLKTVDYFFHVNNDGEESEGSLYKYDDVFMMKCRDESMEIYLCFRLYIAHHSKRIFLMRVDGWSEHRFVDFLGIPSIDLSCIVADIKERAIGNVWGSLKTLINVYSVLERMMVIKYREYKVEVFNESQIDHMNAFIEDFTLVNIDNYRKTTAALSEILIPDLQEEVLKHLAVLSVRDKYENLLKEKTDKYRIALEIVSPAFFVTT